MDNNPLRLREPLTRRKDVLKKRGILYKYPRTISSIIIVSALSIFFSKPIYDIFFSTRFPIDLSEPSISSRLSQEMRHESQKRLR